VVAAIAAAAGKRAFQLVLKKKGERAVFARSLFFYIKSFLKHSSVSFSKLAFSSMLF
jgi:hypothetical protein